MQGYEIYDKVGIIDDEKKIANGGVALMIKDNFPHKQVSITTSLQAVAVQVFFPQKCTIVSLYIPPNTLPTLNELNDLEKQIPKPYIFVGDMNSRHQTMLSSYTNGLGRLAVNFVDKNDLTVINDNKVTRVGGYGESAMIDLVICTPDISYLFEVETTDRFYTSDHKLMIVHAIRKLYETRTPNYNYKKAKWEEFSTNIKLYEINFESENIDEINENITDKIIQSADQFIPKYSAKFNSEKCKSWWNDEIDAEWQKLKPIEQKYKMARNNPQYNPAVVPIFKANFYRQKFIVRDLMEKAKQLELERFCSEIKEDTTNGVIWKKLKADQGKRSKSKSIIIYDELTNHSITNKADIAEKLSEVFLDNFKNDMVVTVRDVVEQIVSEKDAKYLNDDFTMPEMLRQINKGRKNSAPGKDKVSYNMLKNMNENDLKCMLKFYNITWRVGKSPAVWKQSIAVAIPKDLSEKQNIKKYRPVQLGAVNSKVKENMVAYRLNHHIEVYGLSYENQSGFRAKRSTADNLFIIEDKIRTALNKQKEVISIFFDLQKAFDSVKSEKIIECLREFGIHGKFLEYAKDFFKDRKFEVRYENEFSTMKTQVNGVPQGSGLSVQFFKLIMDRMPKFTKSKDIYQFADDFVYVRVIEKYEDPEDIKNEIQGELKNIEDWAKCYGLTISAAKTKMMKFSRKKISTPTPNVKIYDNDIEVVESFKFLGVTFESNLKYNIYVDEIAKRLEKDLNVIKCLASYKYNLNREILLQIVDTKMRSKIEYASFLLQNESKKMIQKLRAKYNSGLRIALGAFCTTAIPVLYAEAGRMNIETRAAQRAIKYVINILGNVKHPMRDEIIKRIELIKTRKTNKNKESALMLACRKICELNINEVQEVKPYFNRPTWRDKRIKIDKSMHIHKKDTLNAETWQKLYRELSDKYKNKNIYFTDGTKMNGKVAYAVTDGQNLIKSGRIHDESSVLAAEMRAVILAVHMHPEEEVIVMTDSLSTVNLVESLNQRNNNCRYIVNLINSVKKKVTLVWIPSHQGIAGNEMADKFAKEAVDKHEFKIITENDAKSYVEKVFQNIEDEKFREVAASKHIRKLKNDTKKFILPKNMTRREQIIITRLRTGYTRYTHEWLFHQRNGGGARYCETCKEEITIEHIFTSCKELESNRKKHNIKFQDFNNTEKFSDIIKFVKEIKLFDKI